jgi:hypothetical protein
LVIVLNTGENAASSLMRGRSSGRAETRLRARISV